MERITFFNAKNTHSFYHVIKFPVFKFFVVVVFVVAVGQRGSGASARSWEALLTLPSMATRLTHIILFTVSVQILWEVHALLFTNHARSVTNVYWMFPMCQASSWALNVFWIHLVLPQSMWERTVMPMLQTRSRDSKWGSSLHGSNAGRVVESRFGFWSSPPELVSPICGMSRENPPNLDLNDLSFGWNSSSNH